MMEMKRGAPHGNEIRASEENFDCSGSKPHQLEYFMKFSKICILQKVMFITDLDLAKSHVKHFFRDTTAQP